MGASMRHGCKGTKGERVQYLGMRHFHKWWKSTQHEDKGAKDERTRDMGARQQCKW